MNVVRSCRALACGCVLLLTSNLSASAGDATVPGEIFVERPTLACLGFRWYIDGDDNRNATVEVAYRARGEAQFRPALPLLRIRGETAFQTDEKNRWTAPNMFAGSILDLEPGTQYEVLLRLVDRDGGTGAKVFTLTTRREPQAVGDGRKLHVYPPKFDGAQEQPAFTGLIAAYAAAQPGDVLLVHRGVFQVAEIDKQGRTCYVFDKQATVERPIVFRAAGDGEAILDGGGALKLIDCQRTHHHGFEGLTFRNADHALWAGREQGATGLFVRRCRFLDTSYPIFALHPSCRDFYVADNVFEGRFPEWHPHGSRKNDSHAVWLQGQGHVICHNRIHSFWDGINLYGRGVPDDRSLQNAATDFYNNEISACADDCVELDYGVHNVRVFRNRLYNTFMGISAQPVYAGPAYIVRNEIYNCTRSPLKPNQYPAGLLVFHNTCLASDSAGTWAPIWQNSQIFNNLFLGGQGARILATGTLTPQTSRLDYNGWRMHPTKEKLPIFWRFAERSKVPTGSHLSLEGSFRDFPQFSQYTLYEQHHVLVDYDAFVEASQPSGENRPRPALDLRLSPGSKAIDAGRALSNINDTFAGAGPDLGAYELGSDPPTYGPRAN